MSSRVWVYGASMLFTSAAYAQPVTPRITVNTAPPGARVYVDGKDKGLACQSGPSCKPRMAKGTHRLLLELDGYKPVEVTINVTGPQALSFTLQPAPARLDIKNLATNPSAHGGECCASAQVGLFAEPRLYGRAWLGSHPAAVVRSSIFTSSV